MPLRAARGITADAVADATVAVPPRLRRQVGRLPVANPDASHARLCLAYVIPAVLLYGEITVSQFNGVASPTRVLSPRERLWAWWTTAILVPMHWRRRRYA